MENRGKINVSINLNNIIDNKQNFLISKLIIIHNIISELWEDVSRETEER